MLSGLQFKNSGVVKSSMRFEYRRRPCYYMEDLNKKFSPLRMISSLFAFAALKLWLTFACEPLPAAVNTSSEQSAPKKILQGADWELHALGITDERTIGWVRSIAGRRRVNIAIVGINGVSQSLLSGFWEHRSIFFGPLNTLEYRDGATDPIATGQDGAKRRRKPMKPLMVALFAGLTIASLCGSALMLQGAENPFIVATEFPSIQDALDEAGKRGGGVVFIPAGTYEIQRTLKIPSNVTLMGAGSSTVLKATAQIGEKEFPDNRVIQNADPHGGDVGIVIKDLVVDGGLLGEYHKTGIYGICLSNCDASRIEGVIVRRCSGEGILVSYGKGQIIVERCVAEENNTGINVHHCSGEVLVRNNIARRNGVHKPQYGGIGIFVEGVRNISIVGNVCTENAWAGIVWMGGADEVRGIKYPSSDALIANNVCNNNGSQGGIFINGTYSETSRFVVTGNICNGNSRDGIWAFKAKDGVIANNLCVNNNRPLGEKGELAEWQRSASGIRLVECQNIVVTGNRCLDERDEKWQIFGICVEGQSKGNIVSRNIVTGNGKAGILAVKGNLVGENVE